MKNPKIGPGTDRYYASGRTYPDGRHSAQEPSARIPRHNWAPQDAPASAQKPQAPEDKHAPGYDNDVPHGWLTGKGKGPAESATGKPSFDFGNAWRGNTKLRDR